jgi:hypothetical protein
MIILALLFLNPTNNPNNTKFLFGSNRSEKKTKIRNHILAMIHRATTTDLTKKKVYFEMNLAIPVVKLSRQAAF